MGRLAPTLLVLVLLAATAAAFAYTQHLKLAPTPVTATRVTRVFSPVCGCPSRRATIAFTLRRAARLRIDVLDAEDRVVRRLVDGARVAAGRTSFDWDGRDDEGRPVPDGGYRPRIDLDRARRTIRMPNVIRVDTARPQLTLLSAKPLRISPDGDGRREYARLRYRLDEHAKALLFVDGRKVQGPTRFAPLEGKVDWFGRERRRGLAPGLYTLTLVARDAAGNDSQPTRPVRVRIRYTELADSLVRVRASSRFRARVLTDAPAVRWRLGRRSGVASGRVLVLRAPSQPGRYRLVVEANAKRDVATVVVRPRR